MVTKTCYLVLSDIEIKIVPVSPIIHSHSYLKENDYENYIIMQKKLIKEKRRTLQIYDRNITQNTEL